ncbi:MAG TPA: hypothetical protein PKY25_00010 [Bacilli bacterium]|nr:hypothetical protein [Bacilli bacterium]
MNKQLYIDFDGVILDTIDVCYKMIADRQIERSETEKVETFFKELDWSEIIDTTPVINDSINEIRKICDSNKFNIFILTHVYSTNEMVSKISFINKYLPEITVVSVPKALSKTDVVYPEGAILIDDYSGNLKDWEEKGGQAVKFVKEKENGKYIEITRLSEIINIF